MGKSEKVDIRLTPELDAWLKAESERLTISKSTFARMILEARRVDDTFLTAEDQDRYNKPKVVIADDSAADFPKKPITGKAIPLKRPSQRASAAEDAG